MGEHLSICPYCRQHVVPQRNDLGGLVCPLCNNTGAAPVAWAAGQSMSPSYPAPMMVALVPNAPGAVAALVNGILSLVIPYVGFIFAFIALSYGSSALRAIAQPPYQYQGAGMAKAGRVCAIVALSLYGAFLVILLLVLLVFATL